jgi:hypothetical protein
MARQGMTFDAAGTYLRAIRPWVKPNCGFTKQLELFESISCDTSKWVAWRHVWKEQPGAVVQLNGLVHPGPVGGIPFRNKGVSSSDGGVSSSGANLPSSSAAAVGEVPGMDGLDGERASGSSRSGISQREGSGGHSVRFQEALMEVHASSQQEQQQVVDASQQQHGSHQAEQDPDQCEPSSPAAKVARCFSHLSYHPRQEQQQQQEPQQEQQQELTAEQQQVPQQQSGGLESTVKQLAASPDP